MCRGTRLFSKSYIQIPTIFIISKSHKVRFKKPCHTHGGDCYHFKWYIIKRFQSHRFLIHSGDRKRIKFIHGYEWQLCVCVCRWGNHKSIKIKRASISHIKKIRMHTHETHLTHLLYFATYPLFMAGALTRPLLMHDKSKFCAKSFVTWLSSFISCTLPFRRCFLLSADDLSSESCESKRERKREKKKIMCLNCFLSIAP